MALRFRDLFLLAAVSVLAVALKQAEKLGERARRWRQREDLDKKPPSAGWEL